MAVCFLWAEAENEPFAHETQPRRSMTRATVSSGTFAARTHSKNCEIFATLCIYLNRATVPDRFSAVMSPNHNKWGSQKRRGGLMHQSTWVVLLLLMFGEIAVLALGGFILWLAGEFGDAPKWTRLRNLRKRSRAQ
jgi:hypothetical protein